MAAIAPSLGAGGQYLGEDARPQELYTIELRPPAPHEIRVVDDGGKPVADFEFAVNAAVGDREFIMVSPLAAARVRTDASGVAKVAWAPRENLRGVWPTVLGDEWKVDEINQDRTKDGITTLKMRRKLPVSGKLVAPPGVDPTGILISGDGFGSGNQIDLASARANSDGSFTLYIPAGHSYLMGVLDDEWATDPWTGDLRNDIAATQVEMKLYRATPLVVRVARGPDRTPLAKTFVELATERMFKYVGDGGQRQNAIGSLRTWLLTDANGIAGQRGTRRVQARPAPPASGRKKRKLEVKSGEAIDVEFYRAWAGRRKVTGELIDGDRLFAPSPSATVMAWTARPPLVPVQHAGRLLGGKFEVEFDDERATVLFFDAERKRSGMMEIGPQDSHVKIDLLPTAAFGGTVVDESGRPLADQEVYLVTERNYSSDVVSQRLDAAGRFHWDAVPAHVPLAVAMREDRSVARRRYYISGGERYFEPGEVRESEKLQARDLDKPATARRSEPPLAEQVPLVCRDAKLNAMRALVVLSGDDAEATSALVARLLDYEEMSDVLAYRVLPMSAERQQKEAAALAARNWPRPAAGEVLLLVLDDAEAVVANARLKVGKSDAALEVAQTAVAAGAPHSVTLRRCWPPRKRSESERPAAVGRDRRSAVRPVLHVRAVDERPTRAVGEGLRAGEDHAIAGQKRGRRESISARQRNGRHSVSRHHRARRHGAHHEQRPAGERRHAQRRGRESPPAADARTDEKESLGGGSGETGSVSKRIVMAAIEIFRGISAVAVCAIKNRER